MDKTPITMGWNESGDKGGDKNPWGQKKRDQGPPNLDEILNKFIDKLVNFFKKGSSPSGNNAFDIQFLAIALISAFMLVYAILGVYIVAPAERAVITRFGKYVRSEGPGPHWLPLFIESKEILNVERQQTSTHKALMLTKDENLVFVEIAVHFRMGAAESDARDFLFNSVRPLDALRQAADSALRHVIGNYSLDDVLLGGPKVADETQKQLEEILKLYQVGLLVSSVEVQKNTVPNEVKDAFDDAIKAQEEKESLINKAQAYVSEVKPKAEGQAQRLREEAIAYKKEAVLNAQGNVARFNSILPKYLESPKIIQTRMYYDTMEQVLTQVNKVVVDMGNGNSTPMIYLPLDKWIDANKTAVTEETAKISVENSAKPTTHSSGYDPEELTDTEAANSNYSPKHRQIKGRN